MTFPTLHLNGTGAQTLIDGYADAATKVREALDALNAIEFHRRDYYVQDDDGAAWHKARAEHDNRLLQLASVLDELQVIALNVSDQRDARDARGWHQS